MKIPLLDVNMKINCEDYTLKEIALYFEHFNGYTLKVETNTISFKVKIDKNTLPHMLGLQHAYANKKDSREYKGKKGFEKLKNGKVTLEELKYNIKNNKKSKVSWKMIQRRIEYLPMFFNNIERRTRLKIISENKICRNSLLRGKYAIFKPIYEEKKTIFPMISLKEIEDKKIVIETFIIEDNISFLGGLEEETIKKIELVSPLDSTYPFSNIKELNEKKEEKETQKN